MRPELPLTFRKATEADAGLFVSLEAQVQLPRLYAPTLDPARAAGEIRCNTLFFICWGDEAIGTAAYRRQQDGNASLSNVSVIPALQGRGVAQAAMRFLLRCCADAPRIVLVTHPENAAALRPYRSFGFVVEARREDPFGDGEPRLVLVTHPRTA